LRAAARGLGRVLPLELGALFSPRELEALVCGAAARRLDVQSLRRGCVYDRVSQNAPHVRLFWQALQSFGANDLERFVEFACGTSRPPPGQPLRLAPPPPGSDDAPDEYLPVSQTCFFAVSLPRYTSLKTCSTKLKYAARHARLMDADFLLKDADGWDAVAA
ncbi:hypothetical protein M885DRAFT_444354, partial [Pelagophyceae sp. CCMP2097]